MVDFDWYIAFGNRSIWHRHRMRFAQSHVTRQQIKIIIIVRFNPISMRSTVTTHNPPTHAIGVRFNSLVLWSACTLHHTHTHSRPLECNWLHFLFLRKHKWCLEITHHQHLPLIFAGGTWMYIVCNLLLTCSIIDHQQQHNESISKLSFIESLP